MSRKQIPSQAAPECAREELDILTQIAHWSEPQEIVLTALEWGQVAKVSLNEASRRTGLMLTVILAGQRPEDRNSASSSPHF